MHILYELESKVTGEGRRTIICILNTRAKYLSNVTNAEMNIILGIDAGLAFTLPREENGKRNANKMSFL